MGAMKNIKYLILTSAFLALFLLPPSASASNVIYETHTPATGNYIVFCNGNYHDLLYCNYGNTFSFDSDVIADAITFFDLGCDSRDEVEMFLSYVLVNADTHTVVAETLHNRHLVCTPDYPLGHNIPTTLEIDPVLLTAHQGYYVMMRASNNERARLYWGVDSTINTSFQIHGSVRPKGPVILIPGIMGSSLRRAADGGEVWPNVNEMVLSGSDSYLDQLKLSSGGAQLPGRELEPGGMLERASFSVFGQPIVTQNFYGDLVKQFTDRGYVLGEDLFEVAYDWRSDLRTQTARLQEAVEAARAASPTSKVNIVAHSMGGLLAKQYLSIPGNAALVERVVLVGTPQLGAPSMFKVLNYGDNLGFQIPIIKMDLLNPHKIKEISQNMPGAYELLPSREYVAAAGGYIKDFRSAASKTLSFDETNAFMTADPADSRNPDLLAAGEDFHDALDRQPISGPQVHNLVACGNSATIGEIRLYDNGKIDISGADGDGTVPLASAMHMAGGYTNHFVASPTTGINHSRLVRDSRTMDLIERLAEGSDFTAVPGIGTDPDICSSAAQSGSGTLRFSTHSPVALHVYDPAGRHTGPAADGTIELGIPDSSYTVLGDNSFAFVPADATYRLVVNGLAAGSFTLKAETLEGANLVASANYLDMPLAGSSTVAEATFSPDDLDPNLSLDSNGDGFADVSLPPTAQLSAAAAEDSEPPQISLLGVPTGTITSGTPFVATFSASDDLSGVATTSANLNGIPFASGATLISNVAGRNTIIIQATDKAGNPKVLTAEFDQAEVSVPEGEPVPPAGGGSGGNSGRAGNRNGGGQVLGAVTTTQVVATAPATSTLPVCLTVPTAVLGRGRGNDRAQVTLLQAFLNRELNVSIPMTGFFGPITELAVKIFQLKHYADILAPTNMATPTGFVGKYTLAKMEALACE